MTFDEWYEEIGKWIQYDDMKSWREALADAYNAGCQSENELWMYADKVHFNGSMYVRTIDKD